MVTKRITPFQLSWPLLRARIFRIMLSFRHQAECHRIVLANLGEMQQRWPVVVSASGNFVVHFRDVP